MKHMIEIQNHTKHSVRGALLCRLGNRILAKEGKEGKDVSVACVPEREMRRLNKTYRNKEYAANVLSFNENKFGLGEIVLCPPVIRKEAKEYGITYKEELCRMLVHGLLHLLGYDHERGANEAKKMEQKEKEYLAPFTN